MVSSNVSGGISIADRQPLAVQITTSAGTTQGTAALVNSTLAYVETSNLYGKFVVAGVAAGGAAFSISLAAYGSIAAGSVNLVDQHSVKYIQYRSNA